MDIIKCEECEVNPQSVYCQQCEQKMCGDCNTKIHNKGKRAEHHRTLLKQQIHIFIQSSLQNIKNNFLSYLLQHKQIQNQEDTIVTIQNIDKLSQIQCQIILIESQNKYLVKSLHSTVYEYVNDNFQKIDIDTCDSDAQSWSSTSLVVGNLQNIMILPLYNQQFNDISNDINQMLQGLYSLASTGLLTLKADYLYQSYTKIVVNKAIASNYLKYQNKEFNETKIMFLGLNINELSYESLTWILRSIQRDRITPTEKIIISRIKEIFSIKISKEQWNKILLQIQDPSYLQFYNKKLPVVYIKTIQDPMTFTPVNSLFFKNEEWIAEDITFNDKGKEWIDFKLFLISFFENSSLQFVGRYGCAQYIKFFGPKSLQECSLGKLTLLVQIAVNQGLLKYNKTILSQNLSYMKTEKSIIEQKIICLQNALIQILINNPMGIGIAQLPEFLKKEVSFEFNLQDLGFAKLKHLIQSLGELVMIVKINKSAIARLNRIVYQQINNNYWKTIQNNMNFGELNEVLMMIRKILYENNGSLLVKQLESKLKARLAWFDERKYSCAHFLQFIQNFGQQVLSITHTNSQYFATEIAQKRNHSTHHNQVNIQNTSFQSTQPIRSCDQLNSGRLNLNDTQFEQILSEAFPNSQLITNNILLQKETSLKLLPQYEDSNIEIRENLRFIEDLLADNIEISSYRTTTTFSQNDNNQACSDSFQYWSQSEDSGVFQLKKQK